MKIVVTGGAGYIGSTTADHLLRSGHEVVVLDNLSHGYSQAVPSGAKLIETDFSNEAAVAEVLASGVDGVMHFAASIEAGESMHKPAEFFENNTVKTKKLIDMVISAGLKYFVFSSTAAVFASTNEPISEMDPFGPANVYGESKLISEQMLKWYSQTKGLKVGILRYFNAAGASMLDNPPVRGGGLRGATHIIPNILQVPLGMKQSFTIFGRDYETRDGTCIRDYIHVDDLALAHLKVLQALQQDKFMFDTFNLGNGNGFTNLEVLDAARNVTSHEIPCEFGPKRDGDAPILIADSSKARDILGWQPQHPELETIVRSAWDWHREHLNGYEARE